VSFALQSEGEIDLEKVTDFYLKHAEPEIATRFWKNFIGLQTYL